MTDSDVNKNLATIIPPKKIERNLNDSINTEISSSIEPPEPMIFNDNYSESDGSNNLMLDELPDNKVDKESRPVHQIVGRPANNVAIMVDITPDGLIRCKVTKNN